MSAVGRNDPCPCGSGKKYKKCCLPREGALLRPAPAEEPEPSFVAEMDPQVNEAVDGLLQRVEAGHGPRLEAEFEALLQKHPENPMTNYAMGVYLGQVEEDLDAAIPFFEKAVQLFPPLAEAHLNLSSAYLHTGKVAEAVAALRKVLRYAEGDPDLAGMARSRLRTLEQTIRQTSPFQTLEAYIDNQKLFEQAFDQLTRRDFAAAAELFKRVLEAYPGHVASYGNLGLAEAGLGHKAAALACLDKALALDPSYEPARSNREVIEDMEEGQPFVPGAVAETEYYRERMEAGRSRRRSLWEQAKFWKRT